MKKQTGRARTEQARHDRRASKSVDSRGRIASLESQLAEVTRERDEAAKAIAEIHRMVARGTHGSVPMDAACAISKVAEMIGDMGETDRELEGSIRETSKLHDAWLETDARAHAAEAKLERLREAADAVLMAWDSSFLLVLPIEAAGATFDAVEALRETEPK